MPNDADVLARSSKNGESDSRRQDSIPISEWVVSFFGLLLVLFAIGFLVYKAVLVEPMPPRFDWKIIQGSRSGSNYRIDVEVSNVGGKTVARLNVIGEIEVESGEVFQREIEIDFLPAHSLRRIGLFFPLNCEGLPLKLTFLSYQDP